MTRYHRITATASTAVLLAGLVVAANPATSAAAPSRAKVVTDWSAIALRTVFTEAAMPPPTGALYLGFTSLAVHDAVETAVERPHYRHASAVAAAAVAAHDVLVEYFPASTANLDADLAASLDGVPDGRAKARGIRIGQDAADDMIESRVGDGRDAPIFFTKPPEIGIWRPTTPGTTMLAPWLGFVKPLLLKSPTEVRAGRPDPLTSAAYARDFDEVKTMGAATESGRTEWQTETALFYNANPPVQYLTALADYVTRHPLGLERTARLFALVNASIADTAIVVWRQKYDVGYWRPVTAIHEAEFDKNPATTADTSWAPLVPTPPYPEWASGHAGVTNAFTTSLALTFGTTRTDLFVSSSVTGTTRHYTRLGALSRQALNARIWLGIHFRDAMVDGRTVGARTATIAFWRLD